MGLCVCVYAYVFLKLKGYKRDTINYCIPFTFFFILPSLLTTQSCLTPTKLPLISYFIQPEDTNSLLSKNADPSMFSDLSSVAIPPPAREEGSELEHSREFPLGFEPLRTEQPAEMRMKSSPVVKDPFCSPLLAPDSMLKGLPPVHIVVRQSSSWND